jgi:hypothetical protein
MLDKTTTEALDDIVFSDEELESVPRVSPATA